jgi:hypothetical protein
MAKVTLDHLREKAQNKFEDLFVEEAEVVFQHVMRLAKADRKKILDLVDRVEKLQDEDSKDTSSGDAVDQLESLYRDVLKAVADDKKKAEALLKQLNLPELVVLFESWTEGTQLGNVSSSGELIDSHGSALWVDMRRFFNVRLEGLFEDPPTADPQEILWFYEQLPDNAATRRSPQRRDGALGNPYAPRCHAGQRNTDQYVRIRFGPQQEGAEGPSAYSSSSNAVQA